MVFLHSLDKARLGFHVSISGSVSNAALEALENNYRAFQMFVTNPRSWAISSISAEDASLFKKYVKQADSIPFAHMSYLCNPSSSRNEILGKSIMALKGNMDNCSKLGIDYLVVHTGSHLGKGMVEGMKNLESSLNKALDSEKNTQLLLENSSGYNNSVGSDFKEIGRIIDSIGSKRIGVCLDTCHAFAYGYNIATKEGTMKMKESIEEHVGMERIKLIHLNDSKFGLGSHKDRHWNIGKGFIGINGFIEFFSNITLKTDCIVMETPDTEYGRPHDMEAAKEILKKIQ